MAQNMYEWDIEDFYSRAFKIVRSNPKLWIAGLSTAVLVMGSSYSSNNSWSSNSNKEPAATSSAEVAGKFSEFKQEFSYRLASTMLPAVRQTPLPVYGLLAAEIMMLIIIGLVISAIGSAWSRGLLIHAVMQAVHQPQLSLTMAGQLAMKKIATITAIDYLPWIRVWIGFAVVGIIMVVSGMLNVIGLGALLAVAGTVYLVYYSIRILFAQLWAYRLAIVHEQDYRNSMQTAHLMTRTGKKNILVLALISTIAVGIINGVFWLIVGSLSMVALVNAFINPSIQAFVTAGAVAAISIVVAQPIMQAKDGILQAFFYTVWHLGYTSVCGTLNPPKEENV